MEVLKSLRNRWNAPTPNFWKKVQSVGIVIGGIGAVLIAPPFGLAIAPYMVAVGSVAGVLSQLTIDEQR
jgi:cytochrome bd-type quinol oxidase subunit 1